MLPSNLTRGKLRPNWFAAPAGRSTRKSIRPTGKVRLWGTSASTRSRQAAPVVRPERFKSCDSLTSPRRPQNRESRKSLPKILRHFNHLTASPVQGLAQGHYPDPGGDQSCGQLLVGLIRLALRGCDVLTVFALILLKDRRSAAPPPVESNLVAFALFHPDRPQSIGKEACSAGFLPLEQPETNPPTVDSKEDSKPEANPPGSPFQ